MNWLSDLLVEITPEHPLPVDPVIGAAILTDPDGPLLRHLAASHPLPPEAWERLLRLLQARHDSSPRPRDELATTLLCRGDCPPHRALEIISLLSTAAAMDLMRTGRGFHLSDEALTELLASFPQTSHQRLGDLQRSRPGVFDAVLRRFLVRLGDTLDDLPGPRSATIQAVRAGLSDPDRAAWLVPLLPVQALRALRPLPAPAQQVFADLLHAELGSSQLAWHTMFSLSDEFGGSFEEILLAASQMDD